MSKFNDDIDKVLRMFGHTMRDQSMVAALHRVKRDLRVAHQRLRARYEEVAAERRRNVMLDDQLAELTRQRNLLADQVEQLKCRAEAAERNFATEHDALESMTKVRDLVKMDRDRAVATALDKIQRAVRVLNGISD